MYMKLSVMPFPYLILPVSESTRNKWWKCLCWTNNSLLFIFLLSLDLVLWLNFNNYEILSLCKYIFNSWAFLVAKIVISTCSARDLVLSLGWEDPLENEMAIHSSTLAWKIPWTEEPDRLQSMGSQRVGQDWATSLHFHFATYGYKTTIKVCEIQLCLYLNVWTY